MANESLRGYDAKVTIGADNNILGMGQWEISGTSYAELDDTEFGDSDMKRLRGIRTGGTATFSGKYKRDDTTGQDVLMAAFFAGTNITDIKFWVDDSWYYIPNDSLLAGGNLPADSPISHVKVMEEPSITFGTDDLGQISFTVQMEGVWRFVEDTP